MPVGELRPQLALLGVHRADEQEARRVGDRDPLALDDVDPERGGVEQHVREVVVEQVDLVDVEDPAVRLGEQPRLERLLALAQRPRDVDRARDPVLGRVQRQVDDAPAPPDDRQAPHLPARARGTSGTAPRASS